MPRDFRILLEDILQAIADITEFVGEMTSNEFQSDKKTVHAVVRDLEVIGEAAKRVPASQRDRYQQVPWQRIAGLRDILIHRYFGIDGDIVWDIASNKLPELKLQIEEILRTLPETPRS